MIVRQLLIATLLLPAVALAADTAPPAQVTLTSGVEYSKGDYSDGTVKETYFPVHINYATREYNVGVTVPYLRVEAPAGTVLATPQTVLAGSGGTETESGLGDIILTGTVYDIWAPEGKPYAMDLSGKLKLGTADEDRGLGTGEPDLTVYANFYRWFDQWTLLGSTGYRFRGDPPGLPLDDGWVLSIGAGYRFNANTSGGLFYDWRQSSFPDSDDTEEITAYLRHRIDQRWTVKGYVFTGFGDNSPDWGSGMLIERRL